MGTKHVTGSSEDDFVGAFREVLQEHAPTTSAGREYRVTEWRAQAGGAVGKEIFYVDVEVSGPDV
ncbi:hypothetical protein [Agromyces bauzanensis]